MTRNGIESNSVLRRQKPAPKKGRAGRGEGRAFRMPRPLIFGAIGVTLTLAFWGGTHWYDPSFTKGLLISRHKHRSPAQKTTKNWKVQVAHGSSDPLSPTDAKQMIELAQRHLGEGSRGEISHLAKLIQQASTYSSVHITKTSPETLAIRVVPREPVVCIEADKLRHIDSLGAVYGSPEGPDQCQGPVIKGLFEPQRKFSLKDDATLDLSPEERGVIRDALELLVTAGSRGHQIITIHYAKYLGFTIKIRNLDTDIAVGHNPFYNQFKKLGTILDQIATTGREALRIDLDYQGKAFIKLRKI